MMQSMNRKLRGVLCLAVSLVLLGLGTACADQGDDEQDGVKPLRPDEVYLSRGTSAKRYAQGELEQAKAACLSKIPERAATFQSAPIVVLDPTQTTDSPTTSPVVVVMDQITPNLVLQNSSAFYCLHNLSATEGALGQLQVVKNIPVSDSTATSQPQGFFGSANLTVVDYNVQITRI